MSERRPISFDRATGRLEGATAVERCAALALQAGAKTSLRLNIRGFSIGCRAISSMIEQREIIMLLDDDARFAFPFGDAYWSWLLDRNFVYEGEIERFLRGISDVDYCFIDGGANFGFRSVLVSSRPFGNHPAIAIEASAANIARLTRYAELNGQRFKILHRAIGSTSGGQAWVGGTKHEAFHVEEMHRANGAEGESVEMMAPDSLVDQGLVSTRRPLVIKLDVEGLEIEAGKGCKRLLEGEAIIILEEHGGDRAHSGSRYLLDDTSCRVFVFDPASGRYEPLTDLVILDRIKVNTWIGYNIFATKSPFWEERIKSIQ
jgi:FkbM family methyltransferase